MLHERIPRKGVTIDGISYYYSEGELRMRRAGGPSRKQVKHRASCQAIRDSNVEFAGANAVAKRLREQLGRFINEYSNGTMCGRLSGLFKKTVMLGTGRRGARVLDLVANPDLLRGFEFNSLDPFASRFRGEVSVDFAEGRDGAVVKMCFDPARDVLFPEGATSFQLVHTLVCLPAYRLHEARGEYVKRSARAALLHADVSSALFARSLRMRCSLSLPVQFPEGSITKDCALISVLRIGFYKGSTLMKGSAMKVLDLG